MNLFTVSTCITDPGAGDKHIFLYQAPTASLGGGVRVVSASAHSQSQGAGTSFSLALHKYSSAGTPAVNGTIAAAIGGTASGSVWVEGVPQAFTIDADYAFLDAGEWLVVDYQEDAALAVVGANITVNLQVGK